MKFIRYMLIFTGIVVVLTGIAALVFMNSSGGSNKNATADFKGIQAVELYQEYSQDESAADQKYIDKVLIVKGTIAEKLTDENGASVVVLRDENEFSGVMCTLAAEESGKAEKLVTGQTIKIKGKCTGMLMDVVLHNCYIQD